MIKLNKNQELRKRLIATDDCHRLIATDDYHRLIATKVTTNGFLQLDFHWARNLKQEQEQDIHTQNKEFSNQEY